MFVIVEEGQPRKFDEQNKTTTEEEAEKNRRG